MRPLVAVVGRPNVGKSTLVNRLVGSRAAIVDPTAGVTRDRLYLDTDWAGHAFTLVDTGGLDFGSELPLVSAIHRQALTAAEEADVILFVVDAAQGLMPQDVEVADVLRTARAPVVLVANKVDMPSWPVPGELYGLGFGEPVPVSATHGIGTGDLLDVVVGHLAPAPTEESADDLAVAVVGRPNAGKSTLVNALLGEERVVVSELPGTTRDAIDSVVERDGRRVRLVDTAGLRRKTRTEGLEYYGRVRALAAMERADLAVLVIDGEVGASDQDQRIVGEAVERRCALCVAISKWDLLDKERRAQVLERAAGHLRFAAWAPMVPMVAPRGTGLGALWDAITVADASHRLEVSTPRLNTFLTRLRAEGHTVSKRGRILKVSYGVQTGTRPPRFTFFANHPELADPRYRRYVESRLRETLPLEGTPIFLRFTKK